MCGIAGYFKTSPKPRPTDPDSDRRLLERMIWPLRHRGPDGFGFFESSRCGLAHARLSIIDLEGGWQPISNEDDSIWVVFNGEIFNYLELKEGLSSQGHLFRTSSDTEVLVHLYEEDGVDFTKRLNGQFAIALYDSRLNRLILARDRMGIRPLFYTISSDTVYFASEIKSLFNIGPEIERRLDPAVLRQIFTFWAPYGSNTPFTSVRQIKPGNMAVIETGRPMSGELEQSPYWQIPLLQGARSLDEDEACSQLRELLIDAVRLRLRADVPVGAYLSGGLDSSVITAAIRYFTDNPLKTFSVTFEDRIYDESREQQELVQRLKTDHHTVHCTYGTIAQAFPQVIWHTEYPIVRTAPTPLYLLSGLVNAQGYKVVLTGEGSDEILGGYDIFKEAKIRRFIGRFPDSQCRPLLLKRLYPYLAMSPAKSAQFARRFFDTSADPDDPFYSHRPRWKTTGSIMAFTDPDFFSDTPPPEEGLLEEIGGALKDLGPFSRAQYLEMAILLSNYLLSSQGDRMAMAHSVEGRFPFLDHRVVEFAGSLSPELKMKVLDEKYLLKRAFRKILPERIVKRKKQPYMAPDILSFFGEASPEYLDHYLSERQVSECGVFRPSAVTALVRKCRKRNRQGFRENMAFVSILSTQIIYDRFISDFYIETPDELPGTKRVSRAREA